MGRHLELLPASAWQKIAQFPTGCQLLFNRVSLQCIDEDEYTSASDDVKQYTIVLPNVLILGPVTPVYLNNLFI